MNDFLGPRQRRPAARHDRRPDPHEHPGRTTSARAWAATSSSSCSTSPTARWRSLATAYRLLERGRPPGRDRRPAGEPHREHRHRARRPVTDAERLDVLARADGAMYAAKARGPQPGRGVRRGDAPRRSTTASRMEFMLRDAIDAGRAAPALPARGGPAHRQAARRGGAGALAAPDAGPAGRGRVHHRRRGDRARPQHRALGLRRGLPPARPPGGATIPDLDFIVRVNMSPAEFADGRPGGVRRELPARERHPRRRGSASRSPSTPSSTSPRRRPTSCADFQEIGVRGRARRLRHRLRLDDRAEEPAGRPVEAGHEFRRGITTDAYDRAIVESIIRLGEALNLGVVAEGIERRDIVEELLSLGCHRGQGYLISRPVAARGARRRS